MTNRDLPWCKDTSQNKIRVKSHPYTVSALRWKTKNLPGDPINFETVKRLDQMPFTDSRSRLRLIPSKEGETVRKISICRFTVYSHPNFPYRNPIFLMGQILSRVVASGQPLLSTSRSGVLDSAPFYSDMWRVHVQNAEVQTFWVLLAKTFISEAWLETY